MANLMVYLSDQEKEYAKSKGKGWVRALVQREMPKVRDLPLHRPLPRTVCPECGALVNSGATTCTRPECRWER